MKFIKYFLIICFSFFLITNVSAGSLEIEELQSSEYTLFEKVNNNPDVLEYNLTSITKNQIDSNLTFKYTSTTYSKKNPYIKINLLDDISFYPKGKKLYIQNHPNSDIDVKEIELNGVDIKVIGDELNSGRNELFFKDIKLISKSYNQIIGQEKKGSYSKNSTKRNGIGIHFDDLEILSNSTLDILVKKHNPKYPDSLTSNNKVNLLGADSRFEFKDINNLGTLNIELFADNYNNLLTNPNSIYGGILTFLVNGKITNHSDIDVNLLSTWGYHGGPTQFYINEIENRGNLDVLISPDIFDNSSIGYGDVLLGIDTYYKALDYKKPIEYIFNSEYGKINFDVSNMKNTSIQDLNIETIVNKGEFNISLDNLSDDSNIGNINIDNLENSSKNFNIDLSPKDDVGEIKVDYLRPGSYLFKSVKTDNKDLDVYIDAPYLNFYDSDELDYNIDKLFLETKNYNDVKNIFKNQFNNLPTIINSSYSNYLPYCYLVSGLEDYGSSGNDLFNSKARFKKPVKIYSSIEGKINKDDLKIYYADNSGNKLHLINPKRSENYVFKNSKEIASTKEKDIDVYTYNLENSLKWYGSWGFEPYDVTSQKYPFCKMQNYIIKGTITTQNSYKNFEFLFNPTYS